MSSVRRHFGLTSTQAKASPTAMPKKLREQFYHLPGQWPSLPRCWSQVEAVSMRIGPWFKRWDLKIGPTEQPHSNVFVMLTIYALMGCELRIWRRYYVVQELEIEKAIPRRSSDGVDLSDLTGWKN